jgi:hypothetical protein
VRLHVLLVEDLAHLCTGPPLSGSRRVCRLPLTCEPSARRCMTRGKSHAAKEKRKRAPCCVITAFQCSIPD